MMEYNYLNSLVCAKNLSRHNGHLFPSDLIIKSIFKRLKSSACMFHSTIYTRQGFETNSNMWLINSGETRLKRAPAFNLDRYLMNIGYSTHDLLGPPQTQE